MRRPRPALAQSDKAQITVLYDAFGKTSTMTKDWGFAAFIEYGGKRILFDTGNNAEIFAHNVKAKGIDLTKLDFAVVSHRHGDHTSGLNYLMTVNPERQDLRAQGEFRGLRSRFARAPSTSATNPCRRRCAISMASRPRRLRFGSPVAAGQLHLDHRDHRGGPGFHLILLKGSWGVDLDVMEISLAIDTPDGIVLVVGCSHPTIEKVVEAATSVIDKPIHLVFGGTHLLPAKPDEITRIATALRDKWNVEWIAPVHCTGEPAFAILKQTFGDRYLYAGLGTTLELGPKVTMKAEAGQPQMHAMDLEDVIDYRVAIAHELLRAAAEGRMRLAQAQ